jgi:hypothetical protein
MYNMDSKVSGTAKVKKFVANGRLGKKLQQHSCTKGDFRQGPGTESSGTNLKQIEP